MSPDEPQTDWSRVLTMTDEEIAHAMISDPEIVPADNAVRDTAHLGRPTTRTEVVTLEIDADGLRGLSRDGGHQERISTILRATMARHLSVAA